MGTEGNRAAQTLTPPELTEAGLGGGRERARVAEVKGKENQEEGLASYQTLPDAQEEGDRDEAARVQQSGQTITNAAA